MKILAIESSSGSLSCAVCEKENVLATFCVATGLKHSQTLMVLIEDMFKIAKMDLNQIAAVAVSVGPGSFTGLRVGLAAAKGIAFGLKIPCIGVETLNALAHNLKCVDGIVCPVLDARRDRVYTALYRFYANEDLEKVIIKDCVLDITSLKNKLFEFKENVYLVGDAAEKCYDLFKEKSNIKLAPSYLMNPQAKVVASLAYEEIKLNGLLEKEVSLKYLQLSQAERERREKLEKEIER